MRRGDEYLPARRSETGLSSWNRPGMLGQWSYGSPWQMMRRMQDEMDRFFNQVFGSTFGWGGGLAPYEQTTGHQQWSPTIDISETDREWCIEAELPGIKPDDVEVQIQNHHLVLRAELRPDDQTSGQQGQPGYLDQISQGRQGEQGPQAQQGLGQQGARSQQQPQRRYHQRERRWGYLERVFPLPEQVDEDQIRCDFEHGVLTIHLPKSEQARQQGRRIPIGAGSAQPAGVQARAGLQGQTAETAARDGGRREPAIAGMKGGETASAEGGKATSSQGSTATGGASKKKR